MLDTSVLNPFLKRLRDSLKSVRPPQPVDAPPDVIAIERGLAWPLFEESSSSLLATALIAPLMADDLDPETIDIVDGKGHRRAAYEGLLAYSLFQSVRASDSVLVNAQARNFSKWTCHLEESVTSDIRKRSGSSIAASEGDQTARLAWSALALHVGGELLHDEQLQRTARRGIHAIVSRQEVAGCYLATSPADNPETFWFHELQIAHAIASFAMQVKDHSAIAASRRAAIYHLNETQPDHATNQPWGLPAFLLDEQTHLMADGLLHAASIQQPEQLDGVTLILLADSLYSLRRWKQG